MARKSKDPAERKVNFTKLGQLWTDIQFPDWLHMCTELSPASGFKRSGNHIKGRCPFHDDNGPSLIITPDKGMVKCFGCNKSFCSPVAFVSALKSKFDNGPCSFGDTLLYLRKRFGLKASIPEALYEKIRDHEIHQNNKRKLVTFCCDTLLDAIIAYPDLDSKGLGFALPTVEYLMGRKLGVPAPGEAAPAAGELTGNDADPYGVYPVICSNQLLGMLPPLAMVANKFGDDSPEYKFFCSYFSAFTQNANSVGYLILPLHDQPDSVCRIKVRAPSSVKKEMFFVDDAFESEMQNFRGFYGLHYYRTLMGATSVAGDAFADTVNLKEGEFDVLAAIAQQIRLGTEDYITLSMGGASVQSLDRLSTYGITKARIIQDRDKGGDNVVKKCMEKTKSEAISIEVFNWPAEYVNYHDPANPTKRVKDPDEAIKALGYPKFATDVRNDKNYWQPQEWCFDQASVEISRIPPADIRQQSQVAIEWGKLIRNAQVCKTYCEAIEKSFGLDPAILFRDIRSQDEDEEGFIDRIVTVLAQHLHFVGIQHAEGRKRLLVTWVKASRTIDHIVLNDERSIETVFSRYFGTLYDFVREKIGDPAFMAMEGEESSFGIVARVKKYREYINFALLKVAQGLPSMDHAPTKAQGVHYVATVDGETHSYLVNGRDVYHLVHGSADGFVAKLLDGPSDRGFIFNNAGEPWLHSLKKAEQITEADIDIPELFLRIHKMLNDAWSFKHQELDTIFLAAHILSITVMTVFKRQAAVIFNAEHESGKSRLTSGFIGGTSFPSINVVAHAIAMQGYTAASIRQQRNNSSLCLCLEEFEDYGTNDAKSINTRKVLELFRDLISEQEVRWSVGTTTGEARVYVLRFPLAACAIRPLRDAASLSRFINFELVQDAKRIDPVLQLQETWGDDMIKQTRNEVALGLLRHMPTLRGLQDVVEKEYGKGGMMPSHVSSRFRECLIPVLTILRFVTDEAKRRGGSGSNGPYVGIPDYHKFAYDFADSRRDQLARLKSTSENEQVFESILSSAIQVDSMGDASRMSMVTTIRSMLSDPNKLEDINKTKKGVYIDAQNEWMLVNWIEACQGVLANTKFKTESSNFLKQVSERSPYHVKTEDAKADNVLDRMVDVMGPCQSLDMLSIFSVKHLLDAARANREVGKVRIDTAKQADDSAQAQQIDDIVV